MARFTGLRGELFAETHLSTESAPPSQDARLSHTHEDRGRPQGTGGPPQKRTSSSYAHLEIRTAHGRIFPAPCACCNAPTTKLCMARANAARALSLQFSSARSERFSARIQRERSRRAAPKPGHKGTKLTGRARSAGSASASRRPWVARWCEIAFGAAYEKSCGAIGRRFHQDGTSSFIRGAQWRRRLSRPWRRNSCACCEASPQRPEPDRARAAGCGARVSDVFFRADAKRLQILSFLFAVCRRCRTTPRRASRLVARPAAPWALPSVYERRRGSGSRCCRISARWQRHRRDGQP